MKALTNLYLGGIAAIYLFWLSCWLVLGDQLFGQGFYNWDEALVAIAAAFAAFVASFNVIRPYAGFMAIQGLGLILLSISWLTYDPDGSHRFLHFPTPGIPDYSAISYSGFVFSWVCAGVIWRCVMASLSADPNDQGGFSLLFFGLALILTSFYYPNMAQVSTRCQGDSMQ